MLAPGMHYAPPCPMVMISSSRKPRTSTGASQRSRPLLERVTEKPSTDARAAPSLAAIVCGRMGGDCKFSWHQGFRGAASKSPRGSCTHKAAPWSADHNSGSSNKHRFTHLQVLLARIHLVPLQCQRSKRGQLRVLCAVKCRGRRGWRACTRLDDERRMRHAGCSDAPLAQGARMPRQHLSAGAGCRRLRAQQCRVHLPPRHGAPPGC